MEFIKNVYVTAIFAVFTNLSRGVNVHYVLWNMFSEIFSLFTIRQIFFRPCVHTMNSPNFPTAKVSLHMVLYLMWLFPDSQLS